jgi:hypothetical protein
MNDIVASTMANEAWLRHSLGTEVVEDDLCERRDKMAAGPFTFLRATYWRWAEIVPLLWSPATPGTVVLAIGDIHIENFGTWRDAEGRLVFGVNDFDEAAAMPWPLDLLRLATSAHLAHEDAAEGDAAMGHAAAAILLGYGQGIAQPRPIILDHDFAWLRQAVMAERSDEAWDDQEKARRKFWRKMAPPDEPAGRPPPRLLAALRAALPPGATMSGLWPRSAGAGSLGRPRWVMRADWLGGPILREAKAMLPSAWARLQPGAPLACRAAEAASGAHRATDPCLTFLDGVAVRRLSPNNSKFEADKHPTILFDPEMLKAMGHDIAAVHAATSQAGPAIAAQLAAGAPFDREGAQLAQAACRIARAMREEQSGVPRAWRRPGKGKG